MSGAVAVTDADFDEKVLRADKSVLVDFWAEWCGPCRAMAPILDGMAADHADHLDIVKVDADANPVTLERYGVSGLPALLLFRDGEIVTRIVGAKPRGMLEAALAPHLVN